MILKRAERLGGRLKEREGQLGKIFEVVGLSERIGYRVFIIRRRELTPGK